MHSVYIGYLLNKKKKDYLSVGDSAPSSQSQSNIDNKNNDNNNNNVSIKMEIDKNNNNNSFYSSLHSNLLNSKSCTLISIINQYVVIVRVY